MNASETRVRVENGAAALVTLLETLPADMRGTAFQHPAWVRSWLATDGRAERRIVALVVDCAEPGRPLMVLPLTRDTYGPAHCWVPLDFGVSDYNGTLTAPDFRPSPAEMRALWRRMTAALPNEASFLYIDKVAGDIGGRLEPLAALGRVRRSHVMRHPLRLDADYATLRDTRFCQTNVRSLARKRRKLGRKGRLEFHVATGPQASGILEQVMAWRGERYADQPITTDFYRRLIAAGDPARVVWLSLDGRPISAGFGVIEPKAFRLLAIGHDDAFKNWSAGQLVVEDAIAWAIENGLEEFDFTIGSEAYKFAFGVTPEPLWLVAENFGPHGSAMLHLLLARNLAAAKLKRWIARHGRGKREAKADAEAATG